MSLKDVLYSPDIYNILYHSIKYCDERNILDCGAGGRKPPLGLFNYHGFKTRGVEISREKIKTARSFEKEHGILLNIELGDMRNLQYSDESFSCVYSWNSSIHLSKRDTKTAISEMLRVLKPNGILSINFIWGTIEFTTLGEERNPGEYWMISSDGDEVLHSVYSEHESDTYFKGHNLIYKNKKILEYWNQEYNYQDAYIDYIIQKKLI